MSYDVYVILNFAIELRAEQDYEPRHERPVKFLSPNATACVSMIWRTVGLYPQPQWTVTLDPERN